MDDTPDDSTSLSRRSALKRIGVGSALAWSAPAIVSVGSAAYAASASPAVGCFTMPITGSVEVTVTLGPVIPLHTLGCGLHLPSTVVICTACTTNTATLGPFAAGTKLSFYMHDAGGDCDSGCNVTYYCNDPCHAA